ncbi:hypothetical protein C8J55DRAFT_113453 [Lentinula edodes]|uniref:YDG domain-containing protein n=1 Tax=Lentinula lateritia TaxID=40482 RepID=A0A9W9B271_9AGAR|nr:hypothetical protein C8J55DRAFT_113453 [Lentinula edodes]
MPDPRNIFKNRYKKQTKTYGYGKVAGIEVGTILSSRQECSDRGLHGPTQAGIHGNATYGAYSVVLSGGYEDDEDNGERVWYTGEGGRKNGGGPQIADQDWKNKNNRSLKISCAPDRYPIRVIRGHTLHSRYAPSWGYRYDGLYRVAKAIQVRGKAGKLLCKFLFVRQKGQPPLPQPTAGSPTTLHLQRPKQHSPSHSRSDDESETAEVESFPSRRTRSPSSDGTHVQNHKGQDHEPEVFEIEDSEKADSVKGSSSNSTFSAVGSNKNEQEAFENDSEYMSEVDQKQEEESDVLGEEPAAIPNNEPLSSAATSRKRKRISVLRCSSDEDLPLERKRRQRRLVPSSSPVLVTDEDAISLFSDDENGRIGETGISIYRTKKLPHPAPQKTNSRRSLPLDPNSPVSTRGGKLDTPDRQEGILGESHVLHALHSSSKIGFAPSLSSPSGAASSVARNDNPLPTVNPPPMSVSLSASATVPEATLVSGNSAYQTSVSGIITSSMAQSPLQIVSSRTETARSISPPASSPDVPIASYDPSAPQSSTVSPQAPLASHNLASSSRLQCYENPDPLSLIKACSYGTSTIIRFFHPLSRAAAVRAPASDEFVQIRLEWAVA